jgi:hypothetical protein
MKELTGNTKIVFLAIAAGAFATCQVQGPTRAASVGALKKMGLVTGNSEDGYAVTAAGGKLHETMQPAPAEKKQSTISDRSLSFVAQVRAKFPQLADKDDLTIVSQAQLWRITKPEAALAKVAAVFRIAA